MNIKNIKTYILSGILATAEFAIGIFLLFAIRRRLMSKITLAVMSVITLITLWIVIADARNVPGYPV